MLNVYLSGEIHTNWRDAIIEQCAGLGIDFSGPVTDHALSDDCGPLITGPEADKFWHDQRSALATCSGVSVTTMAAASTSLSACW